MTVTVCIPAYRAADFIGETIQSVLTQTHTDLRLVVSIDPPGDGTPDETRAALAPFLHDPRVSVHQNPNQLGWAENVNALLRHVNTPFFVFLPHDDVWGPTYLATLMKALSERPDAIVAYADMFRFGNSAPVRKGVHLPAGEDRTTHLLHFLIQGTEAQMWRGLTRSKSLATTGGFPTDRHKGFVVECEYALALHGAGPVVHVPRVLYFKRIYDAKTISASRERMMAPLEVRRTGWAEHDRRMAILLERALAAMSALPRRAGICNSAKEAALLRRYQQFVSMTLTTAELTRADAALLFCESSRDKVSPTVVAQLHLVLQAHWHSVGAEKLAISHAQRAWEIDPNSAAATLEHARFLRQSGRPLEALERAAESMRLAHLDDASAASNLIREIYGQLGWNKISP